MISLVEYLTGYLLCILVVCLGLLYTTDPRQ